METHYGHKSKPASSVKDEFIASVSGFFLHKISIVSRWKIAYSISVNNLYALIIPLTTTTWLLRNWEAPSERASSLSF